MRNMVEGRASTMVARPAVLLLKPLHSSQRVVLRLGHRDHELGEGRRQADADDQKRDEPTRPLHRQDRHRLAQAGGGDHPADE